MDKGDWITSMHYLVMLYKRKNKFVDILSYDNNNLKEEIRDSV